MAFSAYKPSIKTREDRILFFLAAIIGIVGALILKTISTGEAAKVWSPITFDVVIQLIYAFCVIYVPRFRLRDDRAGDAFYYLGLLLTLASLSHTLWSFSQSIDREVNSAQVISGFGLALTTTIVGLTLRAIVQQFRSDPVEIEHEVTNTLADAASRLTTQLYAIVSEMGTFRQSMKQVTEEGLRDTTDAATKAMAEAAANFTKEMDTLVGKLDGTFSKFEGTTENFAKVSRDTVDALSKLAERIDNIQPPADVVEAVFGPARDEMTKMAASLTEAAAGQRRQITVLGTLVEQSVKAVSSLQQTIITIEKGANTATNSVTQLKDVAESCTAMAQVLGKAVDAVSDAASNQREQISQIGDVVEKLRMGIADSTSELLKNQQQLRNGVEDSLQAANDVSLKHVKDIDAQLTRARQSFAKLADTVVELTDTLAAKLA